MSVKIESLWFFFCIVEVKSGADGFVIKMRDGRHLRCVHNNPHGGLLPDYAPHPAIVLKMEDGTGLLLPIIVCMSLTPLLCIVLYCIALYVSCILYLILVIIYIYQCNCGSFCSGDAKCLVNGSNAQCSNSMSSIFN